MKIASLHLKNRILLAPMAGVADLPYRLIMKSFGASLVFTEMISANGLVRQGKGSLELLRSDPAERPLGIQLFGEDPVVMAEAARMVEDHGELLDLNMGCPVNKVVRSGAGSALMREPAKVARIIAAVRNAVSLPLTVKIRSGWDARSINFLEVARIAEQEGADAVTLHPRTRSQGFGGHSEWGHIAALRGGLSIPLIGNGDVFSPEDALDLLKETVCDGVMVGRGSYGNPWLIPNILRGLKGEAFRHPSPEERLSVAREHLELIRRHNGEDRAVREMRKHLGWYSRGIAGAAAFRGRINKEETLEGMKAAMTDFFLQLPGEEDALHAETG